MFNIFKTVKTNILLTLNILLTSTTLIYLVSIYGFSHINKELINNTILALTFGILLLVIFIAVVSFILFISFKSTYRQFNSSLEKISKKVEDSIEKGTR